LTIINTTRSTVVCERALLADRPLLRMRGLMGRRTLPRDRGILLCPAPAIHSVGMRFPIDALFLDRDLVVLRVVEGLRPWRAAAQRGAHAVLELAPGESARRGVRVGDRLTSLDSDPPDAACAGGPADREDQRASWPFGLPAGDVSSPATPAQAAQ
jgi:uncharacterized membrane protein (UPF0127 family)